MALSPGAAVLAAGAILAGTSAGWSWTPYNDAVERAVPPSSRDRVLSVVSTGTTFDIAVTGLVALAVVSWGLPWRTGWLAFAASAEADAALNARLLPRGGPHGNEGAVPEGWPRIGSFWCAASAPLFVVRSRWGWSTRFTGLSG